MAKQFFLIYAFFFYDSLFHNLHVLFLVETNRWDLLKRERLHSSSWDGEGISLLFIFIQNGETCISEFWIQDLVPVEVFVSEVESKVAHIATWVKVLLRKGKDFLLIAF